MISHNRDEKKRTGLIQLRGEEDISKSKKNRLEEKEKLDAEVQRSLAVAEMKKAHKQIEDAEKSRKRPTLLSICRRIHSNSEYLVKIAEVCARTPFGQSKIPTDFIYAVVEPDIQIYESIRFDFQRNMELKDDEMAKLFPRIVPNTTLGNSLAFFYIQMARQLEDMETYCERMLNQI